MAAQLLRELGIQPGAAPAGAAGAVPAAREVAVPPAPRPAAGAAGHGAREPGGAQQARGPVSDRGAAAAAGDDGAFVVELAEVLGEFDPPRFRGRRLASTRAYQDKLAAATR